MFAKHVALLAAALMLATPFIACSRDEGPKPANMTIQLQSTAFAAGAAIPEKHSNKGGNASPPLQWSGIPAGTKSIALVCDDPDAPLRTWVHWVVFGIPPTVSALPEGVPAVDAVAGGGTQGNNSWGKIGYGGPDPPSGTHRYFFKIYALDAELSLKAGATKDQLVAAMEGHILAGGELMGTFSKKK